jgi:hypothetical protein
MDGRKAIGYPPEKWFAFRHFREYLFLRSESSTC